MMKALGIFCIVIAANGSAVAGQAYEPSSLEAKIDSATAPITSRDKLNQHLASDPTSPIYKLAPSTRTHFVSSLVFTANGLGSYSYTDLAGLTMTDAYKILSLFGAQSTLRSVPGLRNSSPLDEAINVRLKGSDQAADGVFVPMADPRSNTVCHIYSPAAGGGSACVAQYGAHCMDGCG